MIISDFQCSRGFFADFSDFLSPDFFSGLSDLDGLLGEDSMLDVRRRRTRPRPFKGSDSPTKNKEELLNTSRNGEVGFK